ncbi:thrombospondin type-1 domain-containing protein 4-like [Pristis pectinata]|uniref:thrombospondin type-1 domain-containing protein 4-like n=1 Tax=Pristis pectinata TaxID=685728 RepID=UPI00223E608B|nr:thrombospondin type-1 domain-containing protein 4-like [Pristis pectinata]
MLHAAEWLIRLIVTGIIFSLQRDAGMVTGNASRLVQNRIKRQIADTLAEDQPEGLWGKWGPWTACTRTCGGGVTHQTRPCLPQTNWRIQSTFQFARGDQSLLVYHIPRGQVLSTIRHSVPLHRSSASRLPGTSINQIYQTSNRGSLNTERSRRLRAGASFQSTSSRFQRTDPDQEDSFRSHQQGISMRVLRPSHWGQPSEPQTEDSVFQQRGVPQPFQAQPETQVQTDGQTLTERLVKQQQPRVPRSPTAQGFSCLGAFRQSKSCNPQPCPEGSRDFREVQCSAYNDKAFTGKYYEWEPFIDVTDDQKCELNCRAIGYKFYIRHAPQVIDGTPCEPGSLNICVSGQCKHLKFFKDFQLLDAFLNVLRFAGVSHGAIANEVKQRL